MALALPRVINDFKELTGNIVILGGSFDPVHIGHVALAKQSYKALQASGAQISQLVFLPTYHNPFKGISSANHWHRVKMLQLALSAEPNFIISTFETDNKIQYTFDTIKSIQKQAPQVKDIFIIHGSDCLPNLHKWHRINELLDQVRFVIVTRKMPLEINQPISISGVEDRLNKKLEKLRLILDIPEVSGNFIRSQIKQGNLCQDLLPARVIEYIKQNNLYV